MKRTVAIIGAGYAGCAAAVELCRAGHAVTLIEAGPVPGGRARRVEYRDTVLDNGLHILLGAYRATLDLMASVGVTANAYHRAPLRLDIDGALQLRAPRLPAPFHLGWALLRARGLGLGDTLAAARLMQDVKRGSPPDMTVAAWLDATRQPAALRRLIWEPLCVAALNTAPADADAAVFANVLGDALLGKAEASDLIIPRVDLSALFPVPATAWLVAHGATVHTATRVNSLLRAGRHFHLQTSHGELTAEAVILATGPREAAALLKPLPHAAARVTAIEALRFESIHSVYLQFPHAIRLPWLMTGLADSTAQWLFDREALAGQRGLIGAVISATSPLRGAPLEDVATTVTAEVRALLARHGGAAEPPTWTKTIVEKYATFAAVRGLNRPTADSGVQGIALAGDYVAGRYPATLEGAVQSGRAAAHRIARSRAT